MHRHVGELGKPLGCCVFPFTFARTPSGVYVGCRFCCPATAYGRGRPVVHREAFLRKQLDLVEKAGHLPVYGREIRFSGRRFMPWTDYILLEETLIRVLLRDEIPVPRRLFILFKFIEILRNARLENVRGKRFEEFLGLVEQGLIAEGCEDDLPASLGGISRVLFRQYAFLFQRRAGGPFRELGFFGKMRYRLRNFARALQFAFALGAPRLEDFPGRFRIRRVKGVRVPEIAPEAETALSRFLAAKLFGKQHFGKLFFRYPLLDGLVFLLLSAGAVLWYARAHALALGRSAVTTEDIIESVRYVDFCYGFSAAPGLILERLRTKMLGRDDVAMQAVAAQF
jgi:hypothetical protein